MATRRFISIAIAAALTTSLAAGCGSASGGRSSDSARAPDCLPRTLGHDAALDGGKIDVSPAPETVTANPHTQISFLGVPSSDIEGVSVKGSESGSHQGRLHSYSQGDGGSFVVSKPFTAGERVSVDATIRSGAQAKRMSFSFEVATPYPTGKIGEFKNPMPSASEYETFRTLPSVKAPILDVTKTDEDPSAGDIFTTNGPGPGKYGPLIYSPDGRLIWFDELSSGKTAEDLNVQSYEGQRDLTLWEGKVITLGFGLGEDLVLNDHYETVAKVKGGNGLKADLHDFQIASDGVSYITALNPIRCNLSSASGAKDGVLLDNAIQEIDMKTGLVRWEWHSVDHVALKASETSPPRSRPWDWFHLNSIDPQSNGDVFISARNTWAGYEIERGSGKILWRLGGNESSFEMGPGTKTAWQHDGRILPDGEVSFFDDEANPPEASQSRAVTMKLDFATHEAKLTSSFTHRSPPLLAASQGNVQRLRSGDAVVGYGGVPWISEYSKSGSLLFDAHLPLDMVFYRAYRYPWNAQPKQAPALVANLNNTSEETIVHVSWNGATNVASWRILAGAKEGSLEPEATIADDDFETSTLLPKRFCPSTTKRSANCGYVAAEALNSAGKVLATSRPTAVKSYESSFEGGKR